MKNSFDTQIKRDRAIRIIMNRSEVKLIHNYTEKWQKMINELQISIERGYWIKSQVLCSLTSISSINWQDKRIWKCVIIAKFMVITAIDLAILFNFSFVECCASDNSKYAL